MTKKIRNSNEYSAVTQKTIDDFNTMTESEFMNKYSCTKKKYQKRVNRYGDPYMNAPLAKIGKILLKMQNFKKKNKGVVTDSFFLILHTRKKHTAL